MKTSAVIPRLVCMAALVLFIRCDDVVDVDTGSSDPILNIDAWVNNKPVTQTIKLTLTQDYFDNVNLPPAVAGATVTITNQDGLIFLFKENTQKNDGSYEWNPDGERVLGQAGDRFTLKVIYKGETFVATSQMGRVPAVDDITFEKWEDAPFNEDNFYRAEFWAADLQGAGDTYWIKTYKNGSFLNKASEINLAYDAGLSAGSNTDGVTFISPIRTGINADDQDKDDRPVSPLKTNDSIYVEIHSITQVSFNYMNEVITQTDRNGGLSELFTSTPLSNVSTNIVNLDGNGSAVVGFFNTACVSGHGEKFNLKR